MADQSIQIVEAPKAKLELLALQRQQLAELQRLIAEQAPARPRPWHEAARADQRVPTDGDWAVHLFLAGRGWGKALALGVRIPTSGGWTTMGTISVGDQVFDENGKPCTVTDVHDIWADVAYRLSFSDGSTLDACGDHRWVTWTHADRKAYLRSPYEDTTRIPADWPNWRLRRQTGVARPGRVPKVYPDSPGTEVRTTQQIVDTLTYGKRGDRNHSIPVAGALQLPDAPLPVHPYVLGVWLGDGSSGGAQITIGDSDAAAMTELLGQCGETARRVGKQQLYTVGSQPYVRDLKTGRMVGNGSLHTRLKALGVLGDKHAPEVYLRASSEQRLALLQGLMDSDGYAEPSRVEFVSTNRALADLVVELACSLGQKPVLGVGRATLNGRDCGPKYRVKWRPTVDVFRLPRKLSRVGALKAQAFRSLHRMIVSAERIDPQRMRCITVDSPNHMYLAGDRMIPTHNSATGANWLAEQAATHPDTEWAVIAPTWRDCRKVCIEGPSGVLRALLPGELDSCNASDLQVRLTNGSRIYGYSADRPDRLRGANLSGAWVDELAAMVHADDLWGESLMPALRIGARPQVVVTTTPRPVKLLRELLDRDDGTVRVVRGRTWDNAKNLSKTALAELRARYEGTRLGRQELEGELLEDAEGALWSRELLDASRVSQAPSLARIVVGVDPAVTSGEKSDSTGIVVAGRCHKGHLYLLEDSTMKGTPSQCMAKVVSVYHRWHADRVVGEVNNGGDYIGTVLRTVDPNVSYSTVRATRGKVVRAEPISALWEQGRAHIAGSLPVLEDQMCSYTTDTKESPDNLDAMVWSATELNVGASAMIYLSAISKVCAECDMPNRKVAVLCRGCGAELPGAA